MIISLGGSQGSGKSTIAKMLAQKLTWPHYGMGDLRRQAAKQRGLTLTEYNALGEKDSSTDTEIDQLQTNLGKTKDNFVIEGRTSWYFIPHSLKIYLDVSPDIGAQRIFHELQGENSRNEGKNLNTWQAVKLSNKKRMKSDNKRYLQYYQINVHDKKHYDFYLDTSELSVDEVFSKVWDFVNKENFNLK